ncbi:hypothetical protein [Streptomyces sp. NPDC048565]
MRPTTGWAADGTPGALRSGPIERRGLRADDLAVRVDHGPPPWRPPTFS